MVRTPFFDSNGMKKGAWNEEEDNKLRDFVLRHGHQNWRLVPKYAGLARCGKSCRLRWVNYLKPGVKRGNFSKEEEDLIIKLHAELGNKWSAIATKLPGRTDNEVKNHWHAHINRRRRRQYPPAKKVMWHTSEACSADQAMEEETTFALTPCETTQNESTSLDASALVKPQQSKLSFDTYPSTLPITQSQVDLWPDRLLADTNCSRNDCFPPLLEEEFYYPQLPFCELSSSDSSYLSALDWTADDNYSIICSEFFTQPVQESVWSGSFVSNNISNSQSESSSVPPQEDGGLYDPLLQYFDYGMNLLR